MKRNAEPKLDLEAPLVYETFIPGQDAPIEIHGNNDLLIELARQDELHAPKVSQSRIALPTVVKAAVEAPVSPEVPVYVFPTRREKISQYFADAKLRRFDREFNTDLYGALVEKRTQTAKFLIASEFKLIGDDDSLYYKRQLKKATKGSV
jgi:hypothetical protein